MTTRNLLISETCSRPWAGVVDADVRAGSGPGAILRIHA